MGDVAVRFANVSKRFTLGQSHDSLYDLIAAGVGRMLGRRRPGRDDSTFLSLRDVSFAVERGTAIGIIGPNGAGKSTALKLLAGILRPDGGTITVSGRLSALIEVGAGFHGDLTGRENIFLNGAIMGMNRREIRSKLDAIVAFAGIERFLDMPVKRYSSGMYARLGFSIASHVDPDVLLVDEVLSVGDAVFRLRCLERMQALARGGTTLVFVTHNLDQMQSICNTAVVLDKGVATFQGPSREAVGHYLQAMSHSYSVNPTDFETGDSPPVGACDLSLKFENERGEEAVWVSSNTALRAVLDFRLLRAVPRLIAELNMRGSVNENLISINAGRDQHAFDCPSGVQSITLLIHELPVAGGQYFWNVRLWDADSGEALADTAFKYPLVVEDGGRGTGMMALAHDWFHDVPAGAVRSCERASV